MRGQILASLPAPVIAAIEPHLKTVKLTLADVLATPDERVRRVYFPNSGVISLVVEIEIGKMIETAMVGLDGVLNASSALDGQVSLNKGVVQLAGGASVIDVDRLRKIAAEFKSFRSLLIRHEQDPVSSSIGGQPLQLLAPSRPITASSKMRALLTIIVFLAAAAVVDKLWLDGRYSHALWQETNYQSQQFRNQVGSIVGKLVGR